MALFQARQATVHIPIFGSDEVTDVTGRRRHGHCDRRPGARRGSVLLRGGAAGQLCRRAGRDEARDGDGFGTGNVRRRDEDHDTSAENWSQEGPAQGRRGTKNERTEETKERQVTDD